MINVSLLVDYSWSDIAKAAKTAMITTALGGRSLHIDGKEITRITPAEAKELYEFATLQAINDASPGDGGIIQVDLRSAT